MRTLSVNLIIKIVIALGLLICAYFAYLSFTAKRPETGVVDGKLKPCPGKPNCVASETAGEFFIEPLETSDMQKVAAAVTAMGGEIQDQNSEWLWATFSSRIFRFVDDFEIRLDSESGVIHVRSASRSGTSDLGVNGKRVETLRQRLSNAS